MIRQGVYTLFVFASVNIVLTKPLCPQTRIPFPKETIRPHSKNMIKHLNNRVLGSNDFDNDTTTNVANTAQAATDTLQRKPFSHKKLSYREKPRLLNDPPWNAINMYDDIEIIPNDLTTQTPPKDYDNSFLSPDEYSYESEETPSDYYSNRPNKETFSTGVSANNSSLYDLVYVINFLYKTMLL